MIGVELSDDQESFEWDYIQTLDSIKNTNDVTYAEALRLLARELAIRCELPMDYCIERLQYMADLKTIYKKDYLCSLRRGCAILKKPAFKALPMESRRFEINFNTDTYATMDEMVTLSINAIYILHRYPIEYVFVEIQYHTNK